MVVDMCLLQTRYETEWFEKYFRVESVKNVMWD